MTRSRKIFLILVIALLSIATAALVLAPNNQTETDVNATSDGFSIVIEPTFALPAKISQGSQVISSVTTPKYVVPENLSGEVEVSAEGFLSQSVLIGKPGEITYISLVLDPESKSGEFLEALPGESTKYLEENKWVVNIRYYSDETWLSGNLVTDTRETEGEFIVMKKVSGDWQIVYAGTGPTPSDLRQAGAPAKLIEDYRDAN